MDFLFLVDNNFLITKLTLWSIPELNQSVKELVIDVCNWFHRNYFGASTIKQKHLLLVVICSGIQEVVVITGILNKMEEDFLMARVFVFPGEVEGDWLNQRKWSVPEETDRFANIVWVLFDFGSSQAASSVEATVLRVFLRVNVFSVLLSIFNYFIERCSPSSECLHFGLVLQARTTVQLLEAEAVHLVN